MILKRILVKKKCAYRRSKDVDQNIGIKRSKSFDLWWLRSKDQDIKIVDFTAESLKVISYNLNLKKWLKAE